MTHFEGNIFLLGQLLSQSNSKIFESHTQVQIIYFRRSSDSYSVYLVVIANSSPPTNPSGFSPPENPGPGGGGGAGGGGHNPTPLSSNPCHPNPCQNGGTCHEFDAGRNYKCICPVGYDGSHCQGNYSD